ncbi:aldehyde dehydrogenase family protein [Parafrankia sp. EUN1f]|uniref:aldehyde dehydrogenase family protein n=1 Tax=Parafrankia sp. EUN1f TaxID=102897 RepID=UPI0001C46C0E|nr:aldehyde dehydrogenase family protein [Parafrankia sp. EUN1f]EFC80788.1 putative phenazine antibiotic biosynthesis protein [Parafrankia sp. EUN1f]
MTSAVTSPVELAALGPAGEFRTRNQQAIMDVAGAQVAQLSLVPPLYVHRTVSQLRAAGVLPADAWTEILTEAAKLFASATIGGLTVGEYQRLVSRVGGLPISTVRGATSSTAEWITKAADTVARACPVGTASDWRDPSTWHGRAVWARRGEVFAVHAAGNHPGTHALWPEALTLGYRIAVRPSRRDPFTPHRLITALRLAGAPNDQVALLPTDHSGADAILQAADLGMVYGGDDVVSRFGADPTVLIQGPGRSKILITADADWRDHLDVVVDSVARGGGTGCVNATAVFVEGDPAPLAEAVADRLARLPSLAPEEDAAALPVQPLASARVVEEYLARKAAGTRAWLGGDGIVDGLGDGSAVLRPAVHELDSPTAAQAGIELSFPCVWIAPWTPDAGIAPLRDSLVLTVMTRDGRLIDHLLNEPTIRNVYLGDQPTVWMAAGVPHDGYLADFLMENKAFVRS